MGSRTRLPISPDVRDRLRRRKVGGDTYDDVIVRLLEETAERAQEGA